MKPRSCNALRPRRGCGRLAECWRVVPARGNSAGRGIDAQILNDQGIDADLGESGRRLRPVRPVRRSNQGVDGDEDAAARRQAVAVSGHFRDLVQREVLRFEPGGEFFQSQINGVGASEMPQRPRRAQPAGASSSVDARKAADAGSEVGFGPTTPALSL